MPGTVVCPKCNRELEVPLFKTQVYCEHCKLWVEADEGWPSSNPKSAPAAPAEPEPAASDHAPSTLSILHREETQEQVIERLRAGRKEEAIQLYQDGFEVSPQEARDSVEALEQYIQQDGQLPQPKKAPARMGSFNSFMEWYGSWLSDLKSNASDLLDSIRIIIRG